MNTLTASLVVAMSVLAVCSASPKPGLAYAAAPVAYAAPAVGYAHAVPQNVPPFASRVDISSRVRAAPFVAAAAPAPIVAATAPAPFIPAAALASFVPAAAPAPIVAAPSYPYLTAPFRR